MPETFVRIIYITIYVESALFYDLNINFKQQMYQIYVYLTINQPVLPPGFDNERHVNLYHFSAILIHRCMPFSSALSNHLHIDTLGGAG